ncbi:class I SAM-dependent methyltransferase [Aureivirga marina]|uniref:class I SAM-dependent methyltransferase n=1 Tax=Aureivirga marina TaxID=1182451 RepID=UPI0018CBB949|nr:class I SAM-dependent methyltransferase [Aureivirga marina]
MKEKNSKKPVYNEIASSYAESKKLLYRKMIEEYNLFKIAGDISGMEILDLACGDGYYSRKLMEHGAKAVLGIDVSDEMIKLAEQHEEENPQGCCYMVHDVLSLEKVKEFDMVNAVYLLNYAKSKEELQEMLHSISSNLKSKGTIFGYNFNPFYRFTYFEETKKYGFTVNQYESRKEGDPIYQTLYNEDGTECGFDTRYLNPSTYDECFKKAGFKNFNWQLTTMEDSQFRNPFWKEFLSDPPIIGFSAIKK